MENEKFITDQKFKEDNGYFSLCVYSSPFCAQINDGIEFEQWNNNLTRNEAIFAIMSAVNAVRSVVHNNPVGRAYYVNRVTATAELVYEYK